MISNHQHESRTGTVNNFKTADPECCRKSYIYDIPLSYGVTTHRVSLRVAGQFVADKLPQPFQIGWVELDVVMAGAWHPKWLDGPRATFVDGDAVAEIDDLVFRAVNYQSGRYYFGNFIDGWESVETPSTARIRKGDSNSRHEWRMQYDRRHFVFGS